MVILFSIYGKIKNSFMPLNPATATSEGRKHLSAGIQPVGSNVQKTSLQVL